MNVSAMPSRVHRTIRRLALIATIPVFTAACGSPGPFTPGEKLSPALSATLDSLVLDEYRAAARYQQVMLRFGSVSPFREMQPVQGDRVNVLLGVYRQFPAFPPENPYLHEQRLVVFTTLSDACADAAGLEQATADRYARALALGAPASVAKALRTNRANTLAFEVAAARKC